MHYHHQVHPKLHHLHAHRKSLHPRNVFTDGSIIASKSTTSIITTPNPSSYVGKPISLIDRRGILIVRKEGRLKVGFRRIDSVYVHSRYLVEDIKVSCEWI